MEWDQGLRREFRKTVVLAVFILVVNPVIFLALAVFLNISARTGGEVDMMFYMLLMAAIASPAAMPLIERFHINRYRSDKTSKMSPGQLLTSISIVKFAFVEAAYVCGLIVYITSGDMARMLCFYPIGIAWSVFCRPRRSQWENLINKMGSP
ncbi:MAG: hypothetical protein ABII79_11140 [bacterium]